MPPDAYLFRCFDERFGYQALERSADKSFLDSVLNEGLCGALDDIDVGLDVDR